MAQYCKNNCGSQISTGSKSGLCRTCSNKQHSDIIRKRWAEGCYDNRNELYRNDENYIMQVSRSVKQLWQQGIYSKERNDKISKALKGKIPYNKGRKRDYIHICKICEKTFVNKKQYGSICNKSICQSKKWSIRKIDPEIERNRRKKISKALKGRIPKNLKQNIKSNNSFRQKEMFNVVKKYFPEAKFNFYIKTPRSFRFLDTAVQDKMLDFEYDGKVHLMKCVKEKDVIRKKELAEIGWKRITINRKNFHNLDEICKKIKRRMEMYND